PAWRGAVPGTVHDGGRNPPGRLLRARSPRARRALGRDLPARPAAVLWRIFVIAQGRAYPVDPETHSLAGVPLEGVTSVLHVSGWVVLTGFTDLEVLSPQGLQCRAPRVAWDGIR